MKRIITCLRAAAFSAALHRLAAPVGVVGATAIEDLDEAILNDIVQSYATYEPTACNTEAQASATSFSFDWPGTNVQSNWANAFTGYERGMFQAIMSHTDPTGDRSWSIRIGSGGNMYSIFYPHSLGEITPPQKHAQAPWIDEVQQTVAVAGALTQNTNNAEQCPGGAAQRDNNDLCKKYFIHQAGAYQRDAPHTNTPFFSPSLAKHCRGNTCTFASWGTQAHVVTPFTSPAIYINRYTNCNDGIIEHTKSIHNFVDPNDPLAIPENDLNHFNVNWGGVRSSKLPYALEPSAADTLDFDDVNAVGNLPICPWTGPAQRGRAEPKNLPSTGGYTTFVEGGLLVNQTFAPLLPPCRKPNVTCGTTVDPNLSCMVESCTQTQIDTQGYVRMELKVAINSSPNCVSESWLWNGMVQLRCDFHDTGFGRIVASLTSYNTCAPWTDIGLINGRTGQGLNIFYLRNWATSPSNKQLFFVVQATDKIAAETAVNSMFNNVGQSTELAIELRALRKNHSYFTSPGTTIQPPTTSIPYEFLPAEYDH